MRLFNEKDKKNIKITLLALAVIFTAVFACMKITGLDVLVNGLVRNGGASDSVGGIASEINETLMDKFNVGDTVIEMELSADEIIITSTKENDFIVTHKGKDDDVNDRHFSNGDVEITTSRHIPGIITVEIPEYFYKNSKVKIDIRANCNIITVKNILSSEDDDISVNADRGIISVVSAEFSQMELCSGTDPVLVSDCTAAVIECESPASEVTVDGKFNEIQVEACENVMCSVNGSINRIDASSREKNVSISFYGRPVAGYTARFLNCGSEFLNGYNSELSPSSKSGSLIYTYGDGSIKINIEDTKGSISIRQFGE